MRYFRVVMRYILKYSDVEVQQALQLKLHPAIREITMTMEEQILERGRKEGSRHKAIENAQKMLARGYDWNAITDITGLTPADLE